MGSGKKPRLLPENEKARACDESEDEDRRENKILLLVAAVCAVGCLFIAVYNSAQAAFLGADVIPASEYSSGVSVGGESDVESGTDSSSEDSSTATVNINTATAEELAAALPGIGDVKAQSIVEYREAAGGFDSVDELINVSGIGEKTLESIRPYCRVSD